MRHVGTVSAPEVKNFTPAELREAVVSRDISINGFAMMVGVGSQQIRNVLSGKRNPSRLLRIRIGEVLNALDREADQPPPQQPDGIAQRIRHL